MKFILGKKQNMTQVWNDEGTVSPSTVVEVEPVTILAVKTKESDGYNAIQVGAGKRREKNVAKAQQGAWKDHGSFAVVREFRVDDPEAYTVGDVIDVSLFEEGDVVVVSGTTKGKGFQGGVKRHNFAGGPRTHGNKHHERAPGSIGATDPARVFKGTKMAGRMGGDRVTVKNLRVVQVNKAQNTLLISGAVPGSRNSLIEIVMNEKLVKGATA